MSVQWKERVLAALVPICMAITCIISPYICGVMPALFYFLLRKRSDPFAANHTLRLFDLFVSTVVVFIFFIGAKYGYGVLLRDGLSPPVLVHNVIAATLTYSGAGMFVYAIVIAGLHFIFSLLGIELKMPLVLRPFEALRGKRSAKKNKAEPSCEKVISTS